MDKTFFPGQQTDEEVLYFAKPESSMKYVSYIGVVFIGFFIFFGLQIVSQAFGEFGGMIQLFGDAVTLIVVAIILWWIHISFARTEVYITDRRIVKFAPIHPFRTTMRTLFWDEAMKTKTYYRNSLLERLLGIGSIEVHARQNERDNVDVDYLTYHEDLGHYIDKILFTFKNQPEQIKSLHKFIPKPRGKRD